MPRPLINARLATLRAAALWIVAAASAPGQATDTLRLMHLDVGQGDATLITTPNKRRILIDAGPSVDSIAWRLRKMGIDTIDLLVSSHNHADHIGGTADVFAAFVVKRYLDNNVPCETPLCARTLLAAANEPDLLHIDSGIGDTIDGVYVRYLPQAMRDTVNEENNSLGLLVQFGGFRALYTGDAQAETLRHWLKLDVVPRVNVLKASHHGSDPGFITEWLDSTRPDAVIISVGRNSHGHPNRAVIQAWADAGAKVFRTDYLGTVQVTVPRGGAYSVQFFPATRIQRR